MQIVGRVSLVAIASVHANEPQFALSLTESHSWHASRPPLDVASNYEIQIKQVFLTLFRRLV